MSKNHPAHGLAIPTKVPDYSSNTLELWFDLKMMAWARSNGQFEIGHLGECPVSGKLMYMPNFWPVQWQIITEEKAQEAYIRYSLEKELLGIDIFAEGNNENRQESTET